MIDTSLLSFINTSLGTNVYTAAAPQGAPSEFIIIDLSGRDFEHPQTGSGLIYSEFQIDCYSQTQFGASTLGESARNLLQNFKGSMGAELVTLARIENEFDSEESASGSYIRTLTLYINHQST